MKGFLKALVSLNKAGEFKTKTLSSGGYVTGGGVGWAAMIVEIHLEISKKTPPKINEWSPKKGLF